jgi:uncharacterized tellurite resistance protein B-like protein
MNKEIQSHLANLIAMAKADGIFDEKEKIVFADIGKKLGLNPQQIKEYLSEPVETEFHCPKEQTKRYEQLYDLLRMLMADGEAHENEVELLRKYALQLGFNPKIVDPLITNIMEYLGEGYHQNIFNEQINNLTNKF